MTNHFVQPGWQNLPTASGSLLSSVSRRNAILNLAREVPPHSGNVETVKRIISTHVDYGGAMWDGTLYQVVSVPAKNEMHIRCRNSHDWRIFRFVRVGSP